MVPEPVCAERGDMGPAETEEAVERPRETVEAMVAVVGLRRGMLFLLLFEVPIVPVYGAEGIGS